MARTPEFGGTVFLIDAFYFQNDRFTYNIVFYMKLPYICMPIDRVCPGHPSGIAALNSDIISLHDATPRLLLSNP